jgi:hypothetical protein
MSNKLPYLLSHEVDGILIEYLLVEVTELPVTFSRTLESLLPRILQEKVLDLLGLPHPLIELIELYHF